MDKGTVVWMAAIVLPPLIVGAIKADALSGLKVPPELGGRTALIISLGISAVLGIAMRPAKQVVRDTVYAGGNMFDNLSDRQSTVQNNIDWIDNVSANQ